MGDRSRKLQLIWGGSGGGHHERHNLPRRKPSSSAIPALRDGYLWERWRDPTNGETLRTFTIITGEPNAICAPIQNRMPVILDPSDFAAWLGETPATADELRALLRPFPAERMEAHMIGPRIGNVKNDDAALIEKLHCAGCLRPWRLVVQTWRRGGRPPLQGCRCTVVPSQPSR